MEKYRNLYRVPSARASWWDYSAKGCYFITICSVKHACLFGTILKDDTMQLSVIGKIVEEEWSKSFAIRNELFCDAFVIMPNHIHAILWIDHPTTAVAGQGAARGIVSGDKQENSGLFCSAQSISTFVAGFKSAVTRRVNQRSHTAGKRCTVWQSRFHDHIIRDHHQYQRILNYILNNPAQWADDKFYTPL